jgi:hypothetical protein
MNEFQYELSLRIEHPTMAPEEVTAELAMPPKRFWRAGDQATSPQGSGLASVRKSTYWSAAVEHAPGQPLAAALVSLTERLEAKRPFMVRLHETGGKAEYFIGWFSGPNSGETFSWGLMRRLGELHIDLALDVYGVESGR